MKKIIFSLLITMLAGQLIFAQDTTTQNEIKALSKLKWEWMAEKNTDKLAGLFHEKAKFTHMSGTWKKQEELDIIKSGSIWYKKADIKDVAVEVIGDVAIAWSRITLEALVRGTEAKTEFTVTEVFKKMPDGWKQLTLTFSSVRDTHEIKH